MLLLPVSNPMRRNACALKVSELAAFLVPLLDWDPTRRMTAVEAEKCLADGSQQLAVSNWSSGVNRSATADFGAKSSS